ncbi:hypothetical protein PG984_016445 [Apiospora sp. TS-2023a]
MVSFFGLFSTQKGSKLVTEPESEATPSPPRTPPRGIAAGTNDSPPMEIVRRQPAPRHDLADLWAPRNRPVYQQYQPQMMTYDLNQLADTINNTIIVLHPDALPPHLIFEDRVGVTQPALVYYESILHRQQWAALRGTSSTSQPPATRKRSAPEQPPANTKVRRVRASRAGVQSHVRSSSPATVRADSPLPDDGAFHATSHSRAGIKTTKHADRVRVKSKHTKRLRAQEVSSSRKRLDPQIEEASLSGPSSSATMHQPQVLLPNPDVLPASVKGKGIDYQSAPLPEASLRGPFSLSSSLSAEQVFEHVLYLEDIRTLASLALPLDPIHAFPPSRAEYAKIRAKFLSLRTQRLAEYRLYVGVQRNNIDIAQYRTPLQKAANAVASDVRQLECMIKSRVLAMRKRGDQPGLADGDWDKIQAFSPHVNMLESLRPVQPYAPPGHMFCIHRADPLRLLTVRTGAITSPSLFPKGIVEHEVSDYAKIFVGIRAIEPGRAKDLDQMVSLCADPGAVLPSAYTIPPAVPQLQTIPASVPQMQPAAPAPQAQTSSVPPPQAQTYSVSTPQVQNLAGAVP